MTIDEAIRSQLEKIECTKFQLYENGPWWPDFVVTQYNNYIEECDQLVSWLKELKRLKEKRCPGEWIEHKWAEEDGQVLISNFECSTCKDRVRSKSNYCPNCGTKMQKENLI